MPKRTVGATFTAGRNGIRLEGVSYARGATIPNAVVGRVKHLSAYLSANRIEAATDLYKRRSVRRKHRPPLAYGVAEIRRLLT